MPPRIEHPADLFEPVGDGKVRCTACARYCTIPSGSHGFCYVRENVDGRLVLRTYGLASAIQVDPVEKKPLSHYRPGTRVLSIGTVGCNWRCQYCQNADISQEREIQGRPLSPSAAVRRAQQFGCAGVTFTYNEPTIFAEYARDVIVEAHRAGLFTNFVTNGYMTPEATGYLGGYLDAVSVDFKGSGEPGFMRKYISAKGPEPILESTVALRARGTHVEITDLIVPQVGESVDATRSLARFVVDRLGPETPFHLLRFHPDYHMLDLPVTPVATLEKLHAVVAAEGLQYVYLGNVWGHPLEHTYCPRCQAVAVRRYGFTIQEWNLDDQNRCRSCGHAIPIVGRPPPEYLPTYPTPIA
jgi:pyruvate formate lyase activating enzyme